MMRTYRRQLFVLIPLLGVVALVAQVAGVGTTEKNRRSAPKWRTVAVLAGASVPDSASTKLASTSVSAKSGEVVRMSAKIRVRATKLPRSGGVAQVVCGIRYSRDGDASWTLGSAYDTVALQKPRSTESIAVERSFAAPAKDRYRMSTTCHVQSPERGAKVRASGTIKASRGLPAGAAVPVQ